MAYNYVYNIIPAILHTHKMHLKNVCMSYIEHCKFSMHLAQCMLVGTFKAIIHAFFPGLFITSSSDLANYMTELIKKSGCKNK